MNYAVLNKFRANKWDVNKLSGYMRNTTSKISSFGYTETVVYLSHQSPDVCYVLSFCYSKKISEEFLSYPSHKLFGISPDAATLEQSTVFRLGKEWRQVHLTSTASTICLSHLPASANIQASQASAIGLFKLRTQKTGLIGAWWGYNENDPNFMLSRLDWHTLKDQQNYFCQPNTQEIIANRLGAGFELEYASLCGNQLVFPALALELQY